MLSTSLTTSAQNPTINNRLSTLFDVIDEVTNLVFDNNICPTRHDITKQIPIWVIYEKAERQSSSSDGLSVFDFIQKYYDWLYCDNPSGAQYELGKSFLDIIDIDKTRSTFLQRLSQIYTPGFDLDALNTNGGYVTEQKLRNFIDGVKRAFYHKKTTEDSIRYFFRTLFGVSTEDVRIEIPKKILLRLNGGKFHDDNFYFSSTLDDYEKTGSLNSSSLNFSRMQDGNWIQDWSYLLKVGIQSSAYKKSYMDIAHPAGLKVVFEKTLEDYQGPTYDENIISICEYPKLKNYSAYGITFDYQLLVTTREGFTAFTLYGLNPSTGCSSGYGSFTGPSAVFPNWGESSEEIFNFAGMKISNMFELCYDPEIGSPNSGVTCGSYSTLYEVPTEANKRMFAEIGLGSDGGDVTWNSMTNIFISAYQGDPFAPGAFPAPTRAYPWEADPATPTTSSPWHNVIYETTIDIFNWGCRAFSFYGPWGGESVQPFWKPQQWKQTFTSTTDRKIAPARWKGFKYAIRALLEGTLAPDGKTPIDEPCNVHIYMSSTRGVPVLINATNAYWESLGESDEKRDQNYYIELDEIINDLIDAKGKTPNSGKLYISVGSAVMCATPETVHLYRSADGYKTDDLELGDWYIMNRLKENGIVHLFEARHFKTINQSPHGNGDIGLTGTNEWAGNPMTCGEYWLWYSNPDNENPGFDNHITNQETPLTMRLYDSFYPLPSYVNGATVDPYQVQLTYIHAGQTRMLRESDADSSIGLYTPSGSMFEFYRISDNYRKYNNKDGVVFDYPNILSFNFTRYMGGNWYHPVYNDEQDPRMKYWRVSNSAIHTRSEFNTAIFLANPFGYGATNAAHGFWTPTGKNYWDNNIRKSTFGEFITSVSQYSDNFCPPNVVGCNNPVYGSTADTLTRSVIDLGKW